MVGAAREAHSSRYKARWNESGLFGEDVLLRTAVRHMNGVVGRSQKTERSSDGRRNDRKLEQAHCGRQTG